jgi:hypothetical protein
VRTLAVAIALLFVPAGIGDSVPALFLKLVNDALKGSIEAREIRYVAPSSVVLADAALRDPAGNVVAKVARAEATVSLSSLLAGDIVISRINLEDPRLGLVYADGKLNLLEALTPKKPPDKSKPVNAAFRIDTILAHGGGFTFTDQKNVTVTAETIDGTASLEVDLAHDLVVVDVREPRVAKGSVQLQQLDVPIANVSAKGARVFKDRVELVGVNGTAAGARVTADGFIVIKDAGNLALHGEVDGPKNAWPDRLKRLPFDTPALHAVVDVTGPFQDPHVAVDGSFARASAYGYTVDSGRGVVDVTKDVATIKDGSYLKAGSGTVSATGTVAIPSLQAELKLRANDVPVARALEPATLDPAPKGTIAGRATITGVVDGEKPISIDADVTARRAEISAVRLRGDVDASAHVVVRPKDNRVVVENATLKGDKLEAHGSGDVFTAEERIAFKIDASADDATGLVPAVPDQIHADRATFSGTVAGPYKAVKVDGQAASETGVAYGVPIAKIAAHVVASADEVNIDGASANAAGGDVSLTQPIHIVLKGKQHPITGVAIVKGANLALIKSSAGEALPLAGRADVEATLGGPYDDPIVKLRAAAGGLIVQSENLGAAVARGFATRKYLVLDDASISGGIAEAHTEDVKLAIPDLVVDGHVHIEQLDLGRIEHAKSAKLAGTASGIAIVRGDVNAPDLDAKLAVAGLAAGAQQYGDGSVDITLKPDPLPSTTPVKSMKDAKDAKPALGHVVGIAARVGSAAGSFAIRAAYAIERKVVNASAKLDEVDLAPFSTQLGSAVAPLQGFASATVDASGPLDHLDLHLIARSADLAVARAAAPATSSTTTTTAVENVEMLRQLGAVEIEARMDQGSLSAQVCAFPLDEKDAAAAQADTGSPCDAAEKVWATIVGDLDLANGAVDVAINGEIDEKNLEDFFPALSSRGLDVGAKAHASAQIVKTPEKPVDVRAQATLLSASVQPPGALRAELVDTAEVSWADNRLRFIDDEGNPKPARFKAPGGGADVTVDGSVGTEDIALKVSGGVALGIAKAFTQQIANANGTAATKLELKGTYDKGVSIEGSLTPANGSVITPRALGQPITFLGGSLAFAPGEQNKIRVTANQLHARVGDGDVVARGFADVRTSRTSDEGWVAHWDLSLSGTGVDIRQGAARAEGSVDVSLSGDEAQPKLSGRVEVTEGQYRKTLELRNFVLQSAPEKESEPLWQQLAPVGLANLQLDVALTMQNFRVRANVVNFSADLQVRGNLKLRNTLRVPQLDGAVEVEEGTVDFPRARFDVEEMQLEFPPQANGKLNPLVHLSARAELPPGTAGNDTEIPVDLFLDGDLQKGMNLDLSATDPQREWTRSDLLGLILFGRTPAGLGGADAQNIAVRALVSEATAPFTAPLEQFVQRNLGAQVELDPGGWRWQMGRRLELEGPGLLTVQAQTTSTTTGESYLPGATTYGTTPTATGATGSVAASSAAASPSTAADAVRLRFLILNPVLVGGLRMENLSLVGYSSSIGQELRLSLRIWEQ